MKQIPNIFTLFNLISGCIAIICILQPGENIASLYDGVNVVINLPEKIWWGSVFIGVAAVVDFLDGFVARLFKAESEMGKQLDSLADVVSFGAAPGMILYQLLRMAYLREENGIDVQVGWLLPALLVPAAAAYRLARFNIDPGQAYGFKGCPAPAAGLVIASLPLILLYNPYGINSLLLNKWVLYGICLLVSWLMVSTLPLMAMKFKDYSFRNNAAKYLLAAIAVVAGIFLGWLAVPFIFIAYIVLSLASFKTTNKLQEQ